jgi:hypothetical protein
MKTLRYILFTIIGSLVFTACGEDLGEFSFLNLKRDNPLDAKNGAKIEFAGYSIYSDNNDDNLINKGEKIQLKVKLKNTGSSEANGVKAVFSTTSQDVSGFAMYQDASEISYGAILAGRTTNNSNSSFYDVQFTVSNTAAAGTQIPINIRITDESSNTWTSSFNVIVQP